MIIDHDRYMDEIGAYLLGALTDDETRVFERHVETCEQCRRELERLQAAADALPRAVEPVEPPRQLKRELMRQIRTEAGAARPSLAARLGLAGSLRPRLAWAGAALVLLVAVGIGFAASAGGTRTVAAQVSIPGARAELVIPHGAGATLRVSGFPAPPRGDIYELWLQRGSRVVPASLFSVKADGSGAAGVAQSLDGVTAVMVTREVAAGVDRPTHPPIVVART